MVRGGHGCGERARQYDADPFLVYADAGLRSESRNWRDCTLNAAGTACSGAVLPTDRDDIVQDHEIGPSPSGGNFGARADRNAVDLRRQYKLEFTAGVQHQVAPHTWYSGSLEYVGTNIWGELADEAEQGLRGKGWLLADVDHGTVTREEVPASRPIIDLEPVRGDGLGAEAIDKLIQDRLHAVPGGIADRIVRLRIYDVPRHVARELDHAAVREWKAEALHFHLDIRRPEVQRAVGVGAPGRRQTLPDLVRDYLRGRPLPAELDREEFVRLGGDLMDAVERDLAGT